MFSISRTMKLSCCVAVGLLVMSAGCASKHYVEGTSLDTGVTLPPGFHALKGHADPADGGDFYGPYPRFIFSERDKMVMVYVPTQTIMMGGGIGPDEVPAREVLVSHFYVDLHEVTNLQFDCMYRTYDQKHRGKKKGCPLTRMLCSPDPCAMYSLDERWMHTDGEYEDDCMDAWDCDREITCLYRKYWQPCVNDGHPVRNVTWREAWHYSRWATKELPSEAQWEAAARGSDRRVFPWGNEEISEVTRYLCNHRTGVEDFDGYEFTAPVLSYAAGVSPFGAYNMSGNVWEWCGDWYDPGRYAYPSSEDPASGLDRGPKPFGDRYYPNPWDKVIPEGRVGPMRGYTRAMRGGSFTNPIEMCRVDTRASAGPDVRQHNVGFRCVLVLPPEI